MTIISVIKSAVRPSCLDGKSFLRVYRIFNHRVSLAPNYRPIVFARQPTTTCGKCYRSTFDSAEVCLAPPCRKWHFTVAIVVLRGSKKLANVKFLWLRLCNQLFTLPSVVGNQSAVKLKKFLLLHRSSPIADKPQAVNYSLVVFNLAIYWLRFLFSS